MAFFEGGNVTERNGTLPRSSSAPGSRHPGAWVVALGLLFAASASAQDDEAVDPDPLSCLSMNLVRSSLAVDDATLLFYYRDGRVFLSALDQTCPGLRRNNRFSYNLRTGARIPRLCHTDTITVIEQSGTGFTCGLGRFEEVSEGRIQELLRELNESQPEVTVTEIETEDPEEAADENREE